MSRKAGKVWGETLPIFDNSFIDIQHLKILPGKRCSMHFHRLKANGFLVFSGKLIIEVIKNDYALTDRTVLGPGDSIVVPPNEKHRFITEAEGCEGIEWYCPMELSNDIVRDDIGGSSETGNPWDWKQDSSGASAPASER